MAEPFIFLNNFSYAYPGADDFVLRDISLAIAPGTCILLEGPTGCGKSTLLLALRGLLPQGTRKGQRTLNGRVGLVMQRPATQLLYATLGADVAFGLENRCLEPEKMKAAVEDALATLGVDRPLSFPVDRLSMGQQYRSCIAGQMVCEPDVILLDEPIAQLDPSGRQQVLQLIDKWKSQGKAILVSEHLGPIVRPVVNVLWEMDKNGRLHTGGKKNIRGGDKTSAPQKENTTTAINRHAQCYADDVVFSLQKVQLFVSPSRQLTFDFDLCQGQGMAILGENGAGKTTLMRCLAGLAEPEHGKILFLGTSPTLSTVQGRLAYLLQDPKKQLFETTVFDEVAFGGKRCGLEGDDLDKRVHHLLKHLGIDQLHATSPHFLSYGQKHLVGLASVLAGKPQVLLLDDPFAGLDKASAKRVIHLIQRECRERKLTVVWTSHDPATSTAWADRVCLLGQVEQPQLSGESNTKRGNNKWAWYGIEDNKAAMSSGKLLVCCTVLSCLAFMAKGAFILALLSSINGLLIALVAPNPLRLLQKSMSFFLWQSGLVVALYMLRFGGIQGINPGLLMAWQLFLGFWPGIIFMKISNPRETARVIGRFLSPRLAFVFSVCLRFLPMLFAEMREIREIQILRGARLFLRDLRHPRAWADWIHCLLVPTLIRTLALADEIALAARNRDFGCLPHRTYWPGE